MVMWGHPWEKINYFREVLATLLSVSLFKAARCSGVVR